MNPPDPHARLTVLLDGLDAQLKWQRRLKLTHIDREPAGPASTPNPIPSAMPPALPGATRQAALFEGSAGPAAPPEPGNRAERLQVLRDDIGDCRRCPLCETRTNLVFGVGNPDAQLVFVGEGPGADEDAQGEPFVGRAGQLLTKIIEAMGLSRSQVYICNVVKCRPPGNRVPDWNEMKTCGPFMARQLEIIAPRIVVALGATPTRFLLDDPNAIISRLRGQFLPFGSAKLMPTFHPAYLLRNPPAKREVWEDMKRVLEELGLPVPAGKGAA